VLPKVLLFIYLLIFLKILFLIDDFLSSLLVYFFIVFFVFFFSLFFFFKKTKAIEILDSFPCKSLCSGFDNVEMDPSAEIEVRKQITKAQLQIVGWLPFSSFAQYPLCSRTCSD